LPPSPYAADALTFVKRVANGQNVQHAALSVAGQRAVRQIHNSARLASHEMGFEQFDLEKSFATTKEMVQGIRELEAGLKRGLAGPALPATHALTSLQRAALKENVRLIIVRTIAAVKVGAGRQSLMNQLANPRFRFLGQIPEARAALIDALQGTGVSLPRGL
jgi:hypothetical protein